MNTKQLQQRWKDDRDLAHAVAAWLGDTSLPMPAGIGEIDNRIDLRGLPTFPAGPVRKIESTRWNHLDLSHADLSGLQLRNVEIRDCRLDHANLKRAHLINVVCTRTSLVSANLQNAGFGAITPETQTIWRNVDFTNAKIGGHLWVGATIDGCNFRGAKMQRSEFHRCLITDTKFGTDLTEVTFNGATQGMMKTPPFPEYDRVPMRRLDFTESNLSFTAFRKCAMDDTVWPDDPNVRVITDPVTRIGKAIEWLNGTGAQNNINAGKDLQRLLDDTGTLLSDGQPFVVVELGFWQKPLFKADVEEALFGAGQAPAEG